ncbi:P-loop containing nucleoside triphosphate hydrolase protein [Crucibulum laeve]|uniref:P-loop containing nucleoside triphosphate hydrolase protein n=1 Tax=Crucibulum laeve TaxID=68775 RepID=A0A5C3MJ90_9AGAR|nr:P-loop containing nucleoside triphosphate hydrolase protein [Crucibulum laeve]
MDNSSDAGSNIKAEAEINRSFTANPNDSSTTTAAAADDNKDTMFSGFGFGPFTRKSKKEKKAKDKNKQKKANRLAFAGRPRATKVEIDDLSQDDVIIAVMGPTGSGKSTFINVATEHDTGVGHSLESCTSEIGIIKLSYPEWSDCDIVFVDTPGFDDTHKSDLDILKMISEWLSTTYKKEILLSGILYFHRISDNRMAGTPLKNLRMFEELCGKNAFHNVILTTTMWDEIDEEVGIQREKELIHKYWKSMMDRKSKTMRFNNDRHSAFLVLAPLLETANQRHATLLQKEMVDMHYQLRETSAGQSLFSKIETLVKQKQDVLRRIRDEMQRPSDDHDTMDILRDEFQQLNTELDRTMDDMRTLKLSLGDRLCLEFVLEGFLSV